MVEGLVGRREMMEEMMWGSNEWAVGEVAR